VTASTPQVIVVTGATGFTGPFVIRALRQRFPDARLRAVVRDPSRVDRIDVPDVEVATADLRDQTALTQAFAGADVLVNVASLGFDWNPAVIGAARAAGIRRGIFIGTTAMLTTLAVASRSVREEGERLVRESGLVWTILRPTMIYGTPEDRNIVRLLRFVSKSPIVPLPGGGATQQPVHVADVAEAVAGALASAGTANRAYNISGAEPLTLRELVREAAAAVGRRPMLVPIPLGPIARVADVWRRVGRPPLSGEQIRRIGEDKAFDHQAATKDFGFAPRTFRDGVQAEAAMLGPRR
jgi:uncharacterized protein YbjT (DUF2867 family)